MCSQALWKAKLVGDNHAYSAKEICKHNVEGAAWFLLLDYSKLSEERDELKKAFLTKKELETKHLENSRPLYIAKT